MYEKIELKLKELKKLSATDPNQLMSSKYIQDKGRVNDPWSGLTNKMERIDGLLKEMKQLAKENKTFLGRSIKFPIADSYALYVVTKIKPKTMVLEWIDYMDGWVDDRLGKKGELPMVQAVRFIRTEDAMDEFHDKFN